MAQFYFNTRTGQVEELARKSQGKHLLGPYPTREQAQHALDQARQRTEDWDRDDREWDNGRETTGGE
ncbi:MAG: hypothetical protein ACRC35_06565 [Angustibacter sp.]